MPSSPDASARSEHRQWSRRGVLATGLTIGVAGCLEAPGEGATLSARAEPMVDEDPEPTIENLSTDRVRLEASTEDRLGTIWESNAVYPVRGDSLSVSSTAPVAGRYEGTDPWGLFWSMEPTNTDDLVGYAAHASTQQVSIQVYDDHTDSQLTEQTIDRHIRAPESEQRQLDDELYGVLTTPPGGGPAPGVIFCHGSAGIVNDTRASVIAAHGYTTLALRYFGDEADGLPDNLVEVPIDYVERAIDWLTAHEAVTDDPVAIEGYSRGGELAMLMATRRDDIGAVINRLGASELYGGFVDWGVHTDEAAWLIDGEPNTRLDPVPVEEIDAPTLLISAEDDEVWNSYGHALQTETRFELRGFDNRWEHLSYEEAGHGIATPSLPTYSNQAGGLGGTPEATARAEIDSWPVILEYIRDASD